MGLNTDQKTNFKSLLKELLGDRFDELAKEAAQLMLKDAIGLEDAKAKVKEVEQHVNDFGDVKGSTVIFIGGVPFKTDESGGIAAQKIVKGSDLSVYTMLCNVFKEDTRFAETVINALEATGRLNGRSGNTPDTEAKETPKEGGEPKPQDGQTPEQKVEALVDTLEAFVKENENASVSCVVSIGTKAEGGMGFDTGVVTAGKPELLLESVAGSLNKNERFKKLTEGSIQYANMIKGKHGDELRRFTHTLAGAMREAFGKSATEL